MMTLKVFLFSISLWLTFTTFANGQYSDGPRNYFTPQWQPSGNLFTQPNRQQNSFSPGGPVPNFPPVTNPQNFPNSNTFPPHSSNIPEFIDLSSLLPPEFMNPRTSPRPQNPSSYNPVPAPQRPVPTYPQHPYSNPQQDFTNPQQRFSTPQQTFTYPQQPFSNPQQSFNNPQHPLSYPQPLFNTDPQRPNSMSPIPQPTDSFAPPPQKIRPQVINPSSLRQQLPNPGFSSPQQPYPSYTKPEETIPTFFIPQQTKQESVDPQQNKSFPPTVPQSTDSRSEVPLSIDSLPPTVPQNNDYSSKVPQNINSVPPTVYQPTNLGSTIPQTTNPAAGDGQQITSSSEPSDSKRPQDLNPAVPAHPHHGRSPGTKYRPRIEPTMEPSADPLRGLRIVCLFNNRHFYKNGFTPAQLEPHLCTHLNYEFAVLDPKTYEMMTGEPDLDMVQNFYSEAIGLKKVNPKLKVMMSLGGWSDSTKKYSELAEDPAKRENFIKKAVPFLKDHGFDGMDLAWEYPNCWQGALGVSPKDKQNFVTLLKEIKQEFEQQGLLLSVSVGAIKREVEAAYDVPEVSKNVDYINVMTYDMHGPWEPKTGHHVQFEEMDGDTDKYCNVKGGMNVWIEKGASKKKLNMGLANYGRSFRLKDPEQHGMGAPAIGPGAAGPVTHEGGKLDYHEICKFLNSGNWTEKEHKQAGFYAYSGDQWVGFDPPRMMVRKVKYVVEFGLGGILMKDLSGDDSRGDCFNMPFPLLKMARMEMMHKVRQMYA